MFGNSSNGAGAPNIEAFAAEFGLEQPLSSSGLHKELVPWSTISLSSWLTVSVDIIPCHGFVFPKLCHIFPATDCFWCGHFLPGSCPPVLACRFRQGPGIVLWHFRHIQRSGRLFCVTESEFLHVCWRIPAVFHQRRLHLRSIPFGYLESTKLHYAHFPSTPPIWPGILPLLPMLSTAQQSKPYISLGAGRKEPVEVDIGLAVLSLMQACVVLTD